LETVAATEAHTRLIWSGDGLFVGIDTNKHSVVISTQDEDRRVGMKPSDLLLVSLAACSAVDVVAILRKKRQTLTHLEVAADGVQDPDPPWKFRKIHLTYLVEGRDLTAAAVARAIELSEGKYCSVAASLRPQVEITTSFEIHPAKVCDELQYPEGIAT
jgi:putative redox protein